MKVGFTGTQKGMTPAQLAGVKQWITLAEGFGREPVIEFHHGDCIGADEQAALIANNGEIAIVCHPPQNNHKRAYAPAHFIRDPLPYLERNHAIVDETDHLLATPKEDHDVLRSGTWATIRYARNQGKPITIIWPDGSVDA